MLELEIREARPEDASALVELEQQSPEVGRITFRLDARPDGWPVFARYPDAQGYVALDRDTSAIIGVISSSGGPTQINGRLVPAAYLFGLRVHPGHRQRGVASALIAHACERAGREAGARTAWAAIIEGNVASLRTVDRSGFRLLRDLHVKMLLSGIGLPPLGPRVPTRPASAADLPALAEALNRSYAGHNFWRPKTVEGLQAESSVLRHSARDCEVAVGKNGEVLAAACGLELDRVARLRILGIRPLPSMVNRLLAPLLGRIPVNPVLLRHCAYSPNQPAAALAVLHGLGQRHLPRSWATVVTADPVDPLWTALDRTWGVTGRVHLVVRSDEPIDETRPSYLPQ